MGGSGSDIRAGKAFVEVYLNKSALVKGLKGVSAEVKRFGEGISTIGKRFAMLGGAIVGPMVLAANSWAEAGGALMRVSEQTGVAVEALSALKFAAQQNDVEFETLAGGLNKMNKAIAQAATGKSKGGMDSFLKGLAGKDSQEQIDAIADRLQRLPTAAEQTAFAMKTLGKSGAGLIPILKDGAEGLRRYRQEAEEAGLIKTKAEAQAADELESAFKKSKTMMGSVKNALGAAVAPLVKQYLVAIQNVAKQVRQWIKEHGPLIRQVFLVGGALLAGGTAVMFFGKAIKIVSTVIKFGVTAIQAFGHAVAVAGNLLTFFSNPWVLLGALVLGVVGYILYASGAFDDSIESIKSALSELWDETKSTMGQISESMAAGDITSAAKVGWAFIKMEWQKGVNFIQGVWEDFKAFWNDAVSGLALGFINAASTMRKYWNEIVGWIAKRWNDWSASAATETIASWLAPLVAKLYGVSTEEVRKNLSQDFKTKRSDLGKQNADVDAETQRKNSEIEKERQAQEAVLADDVNRRNSERSKRQAAADAELAKARAEWESAKTEAHEKALAIAQKKKKEEDKKGGESFLGGTGKIEGTFSASAVEGLGGGSPMVRLVKLGVEAMQLRQQQLAEQKKHTIMLRKLGIAAP